MQRSTLALLGILILAQLFIPAVLVGGELSTSFEFDDLSGLFALGDPPNVVTFAGGEAKSIGNFDLYHTGTHSWMMSPGATGTITFETPPEEIELFIRHEDASGSGVLTVLDDEGQILEVFNSTDSAWTTVSVTAPAGSGIGTVTLENSGGVGHAVIDDFTCVAGTGKLDDPIPEPIPAASRKIQLETVADGLTAPNFATSAPGLGSRILFVTDQDGILWQINLDSGLKRIFFDVSSRLVDLGIAGPGTFDERGLLGVAFHPEYPDNGLFYIYTSEPPTGIADFSTLPPDIEPDHQTVISQWTVPDPVSSGSLPDPGSEKILLRIDEPQFNHNGGALNFGPDGMLYISLGDGGNADDEGDGHGNSGNGRNPRNVLGSILRVDPTGANSRNGQYGVPLDNPFVGPGPLYGGEEGCTEDGRCDEIFAFGFRNPFRFSFDSQTGTLFVGDVGQNDIEEVNMVISGRNYGWNRKEGTFCFDGNGEGPGFVTECDPGQVPPNLVDPVAQYDHDEGIAIIGGFVYRGQTSPSLRGRYIFGDFARTFANDGRIFLLSPQGGIFELLIEGQVDLGRFLLGFGQDARGEVYVLANSTGTPFEETGVVLRLSLAP